MPRVIHFELFADEPERAATFYSDVFGWNLNKYPGPEDYWLISTGEENAPGINGGLARRAPNRTATTNTIDVPSVDEFAEKILAAGGKIIAPKMPIPGVGYLAYCQDTENNVFGIIQNDPSAH
jgi:predicted enzyme related to lactoylglutathione lyase